jgi:hypothetical protein
MLVLQEVSGAAGQGRNRAFTTRCLSNGNLVLLVANAEAHDIQEIPK